MEKERAYFLIGKWIDGNIDPTEKTELDQWLAAEPNNQRVVDELRMILGAVDQQIAAVDPKTEQSWASLSAQIRAAETTPVISVTSFSKGNAFWKVAVAAAVALLVMVGGYFVLGGSDPAKSASFAFATQNGETKVVKLPDGSSVHLNSASQLKAMDGFGGKDRQVALQGEAYFEIAHDPSKPFIVHTGSTQTKVLGTKFNLRGDYRSGDDVYLSVLEGKVQFGNFERKDEMVFTANQSAIYDTENKTLWQTDAPASGVAAWREGVLSFYHETLYSAIPRLNHFYDIDLRLGDGLKDARLTARFVEKDATAMLDVLAATFSAKVRREGRTAWLEK